MDEPATSIEVKTAPPYQVTVGAGTLRRLLDFMPADWDHAMIVFPAAVSRWVLSLVDYLRDNGVEVHLLAVPDGEAAKSLRVAEAAWARLGEAMVNRGGGVVAVGGGATTDLAGFIAGTWQRGVRVLHVPTTLLAMVDAAIGGKAAINTEQGKNLVGVFHQPTAVVCDPDVLSTLPREHIVSGMAEIIKAGLIKDPAILDVVWSGPQETLNPGGPLLPELIRRAVAVKADVVGQDPHESGLRAILNYGHTFGHAIEQAEHYEWLHGNAVAVGMVFAAEVAVRSGVMDPSLLGLHREILTSVGLPTSYKAGRWESLWQAMRRDKKNLGRTRRMVLLEDVGRPVVVQNVPEALLEEAYQAVAAARSSLPYPKAQSLENPYGQVPYIPPVDEEAAERAQRFAGWREARPQ
ncbi:MAG: 3-dehydroquinate synthase [Bifidobacteriaceae bacterium]|jgi:3-dehydroquinate synthase|nr:3-dehydroquinate synthase [Bifidobacteriaceae bacterium]